MHNSNDPSDLALKRYQSVNELMTFCSSQGVMSRDSVRFMIDDDGQIRCIANHFIPANKHILHVPFRLDLSFSSLKLEVHPDKAWNGWNELKNNIKKFENGFQVNPYAYEQKDYFSKNMMLLMCIVGILHKLEEEPDLDQHSDIVQAFYHYWNSLPSDIGSILFDWTEAELACLQGSSLYSCLPDAKRLGEEMYHQVFIPFIRIYCGLFGGRNPISLEKFLFINSVILTRSFGSSARKDRICLLPVIDLVNGKPSELHNAVLENCAIQSTVNGEFHKYHILTSSCDIYAGDEICIEYAQVGNGDYLLTYNCIPLDPEVIMNNQKTDVYLDLSEFLETELLRMHPDTPTIRTLKRQHVYGFFNLPKVIPMSMEDLFSTEYSCIPSIRQVLIFLQFDEKDAQKAIRTSRIKSQLTPHQLRLLFHMFLKFIDCSIEKVNMPLIKAVLSHEIPVNTLQGVDYSQPIPLTSNMRSAIYLQMSERLVIEVMISRFINLFPESFHELGYSIMRSHLISSEINTILEELCRPAIVARQNQCLICGSCTGVSKCSRCRKAYYCSSNCQKEHWPYHKKVCKPLTVKEAAASASAVVNGVVGATTATVPYAAANMANIMHVAGNALKMGSKGGALSSGATMPTVTETISPNDKRSP